MGFLDRLLGRKKGPDPEVLFDSDVKKMDVRYASFLWLLDSKDGKEFCGTVSIRKVIIDLEESDLNQKVRTKTDKGLVKIPLKDILDRLGNKHTYYKFVHFKRPLHVKVFGALQGDVELTFSPGKLVKKSTGTKVAVKDPKEAAPSGKEPEVLESEG